jgi:hypothetical protein
MTLLARWSLAADDDACSGVTRSIDSIRRFARSRALVCTNEIGGHGSRGIHD